MTKPDEEAPECAFCHRTPTKQIQTRSGNTFDLCDTCAAHVALDSEEIDNCEIHDERCPS